MIFLYVYDVRVFTLCIIFFTVQDFKERAGRLKAAKNLIERGKCAKLNILV